MSKQKNDKHARLLSGFFSFRCGQRLRVWSKHQFELKQMQQTMCREFSVAYFSLQTKSCLNILFSCMFCNKCRETECHWCHEWLKLWCLCLPRSIRCNRKSEKWNQQTGFRSLLDGTQVTVKLRLESQGVFFNRRWHTWRVFVKSYGINSSSKWLKWLGLNRFWIGIITVSIFAVPTFFQTQKGKTEFQESEHQRFTFHPQWSCKKLEFFKNTIFGHQKRKNSFYCLAKKDSLISLL